MKKIITLALCLLMSRSMASCSSQTAETEKTSASSPSSETAETEESSPATFDSNWTNNEYATLIPEPPLYEYSTEITEGEGYTLCTMMNTASPSTDYLHITEETFLAYTDQLQQIGYNENLVNMKTSGSSITFSAWKDNIQVDMEYCIWDEESGYIVYIDIYEHH